VYSTAAPSAEAAAKPGLTSLALFVPSVVCGCLAYWQFERKEWKENLIKLRSEMLSNPARDLFGPGDPQTYEKVTVSGVLLHDKSLFVGPRPRSIPGMGIQSGYLVVTPIYDSKRNAVALVNRGWAPNSWLGDSGALSRSAGTTGPVTLTGVVQPNEEPSAAMPDNNLDKLEFHWVDVPALARACGLPPDTPLVQQLSDDPSTIQQGKAASPLEASRKAAGPLPTFPVAKNSADLTRFVTMPSDHLIYAGIWSSLCVILGFMARHAIVHPPKRFKIVNNQQLWSSVNKQ